MNERINELMKQTGVPLSMPFDKWCEKFAELIVRECVSVADKRGAYEVMDDILEHFGVDL